jgi:hypothetical protein
MSVPLFSESGHVELPGTRCCKSEGVAGQSLGKLAEHAGDIGLCPLLGKSGEASPRRNRGNHPPVPPKTNGLLAGKFRPWAANFANPNYSMLLQEQKA